ncbi:MAG: hypothetical protein J2P26_10065 [Nocardiopsaceae bacterium]|nr:hypothetical protein [Nocardiopsaceae bacterium]
MQLSSGQQRGLFVVIVVVLGGLGAFLISSNGNGGSAQPAPTASAASGAPQAPGAAPPSGTGAATGPVTQAPPVGTTSQKGQANIYDWLPFSRADLTSAARATLAFATAYGTWTYTETPAAYVAKMNNLVTGQLASTLKASYATPQLAAQRTKQKQVSQGSGGIEQIRSFASGSESITFLVNISQKLTSTAGASTTSTQYAVTCVPGPGSWEVNDIEYAAAGNS